MIDTHAHLSFSEFQPDLEEVIARAKKNNVEKIVNVGCDEVSCRTVLEMQVEHEGFLYVSLGMHPYEAEKVSLELLEEWEKEIRKNKSIVAIGECGLDYFKANVSPEIQKKAFRMQLELANRMGLPVIIHNRQADQDCFRILEEFENEGKKLRVVFHCFGSDLEFARELWKKGYLTSFTGIITYPNARSLREVVKEVPDDLFMIETDSPYLAPQKYRGKRNEPSYVFEVLAEISRLKGWSFSECEKVSVLNSQRFFEIG